MGGACQAQESEKGGELVHEARLSRDVTQTSCRARLSLSVTRRESRGESPRCATGLGLDRGEGTGIWGNAGQDILGLGMGRRVEVRPLPLALTSGLQ